MAITVKDLLSLPIYQNHVGVVSERGMDNEVLYLTVMETPDFHIDTLDSKTMILTTLSAYHKDEAKVLEVVEDLCRANVAAIAIKLGRYVDHINPDIIAVGERYRVPILTVDKETYFREILSSSLSYIADDQFLLTQKTIDFEGELQDILFRGGSMEEVFHAFTSKAECYCCLADAELNIIVESNLPEMRRGKEEVTQAVEEYRRQIRKDPELACWEKGKELLVPCGNQKEVNGYIYVCFTEGPDPFSYNMVQSMSRTISIMLFEHVIEDKAKRELVSAILDDILFSDNVNEMLTIDRLKLFGFVPNDKHALILLKQTSEEKKAVRGQVVQNIFKRYITSAIAFEQGDLFIVLVSELQKVTNTQMKELIEKACAQVSDSVSVSFQFGVSLIVSKFHQISDCYSQAKKAIHYGAMMNPEQSCYFYTDYLEIGLLSHALHTSTSSILFREIINPIKEYDKKYDMTLWDTMVHCFYAPTLDSVAKDLFIHISTLRYRLQKIEILTGYNYFETKDRRMLYMVYLLYTADQAEE